MDLSQDAGLWYTIIMDVMMTVYCKKDVITLDAEPNETLVCKT
jgi:hypothetical protein